MPIALPSVRALVAARALALAVGFLGACSNEQVQPPGDDTDDPATSADPTGPSSATDTAGTTTEDPTGTGTTTDDTTTGEPPTTTVDTTGDPAECETPEGCWSCPPTTHKQHLNACTDATCEPFPNTKDRLPLLEEDGTLPPLP